MEMVLLDWTRMGRSFCVAGAAFQDTYYRVVRPLLTKNRQAPVRNVGWPAYLLERHVRWEIFELIKPEPADPQAPHSEDIWVQALRPRNRLASREQCRAILEATAPKPEESSGDPVRQIATLNTAVMQMGERVAVRLGLSRPFQSDARQPAMCWLMADGFFSLHDPQP